MIDDLASVESSDGALLNMFDVNDRPNAKLPLRVPRSGDVVSGGAPKGEVAFVNFDVVGYDAHDRRGCALPASAGSGSPVTNL